MKAGWAITGLLLLGGAAFAQPYATRPCRPEEVRRPMSQYRASRPDLAQLSDPQVVELLQRAYYPDLTTDDVACAAGVVLPASPDAPKKLGPFDQWRYDGCRTEAAKNPTGQGVQAGMNVCREKFRQ